MTEDIVRINIPEFEEYLKTHGMWDQGRPWSEIEEQIINDYYGIIPTDMLAKRLDRTIKSVQDKAYAMGIKAEDNRKKREATSTQ